MVDSTSRTFGTDSGTFDEARGAGREKLPRRPKPVAAEDCTAGLWVARAGNMCWLRIVGRGTLRESAALRELGAACAEANPTRSFAVALDACDYLDSTFLGCLVGMMKRFHEEQFLVAASDEQTSLLLAPLQLHRILPIDAECSIPRHGWTLVVTGVMPTRDFGRQILEAHECLLECDTPQREAFERVVESLKRESTQ